ncbi:MAG TPA: hypothetical protein VK041_10810 [Opitutales bacterium]|nr:hypothetical protein [Opitutales bacterium]
MAADLEQLATFFRSLGAEEDAASVMASQLLKRADQLAAERSVSRLEAIDYLLKVTVAGREGVVYDGPVPGKGTTKREKG